MPPHFQLTVLQGHHHSRSGATPVKPNKRPLVLCRGALEIGYLMAALESADTRRHLTLQEESAARLAPSRLVGQWISTAYGVGHVKSFAKTWNPLLYDSKHEVHFPEHGALELVLRRRKFAGWNSGIPFHLVQVVTPPVMSAQEGSGGSSSSDPSGSSGGGGEVLPPQSLERAAGEEATLTVQALPQLTGSATPRPLPADCLLYTSPSPRDLSTSRMPSSA